MDDNIINLDKERDKREGPDPNCRMRDHLGREMFLFLLDYQFEEGSWSMELWAYSQEDAEARVAAVKKTLKYCGQAYSIIPV